MPKKDNVLDLKRFDGESKWKFWGWCGVRDSKVG